MSDGVTIDKIMRFIYFIY